LKDNVILYDNYGSVIANGVNYEWRGDFLGFTIGDSHSSELGIVRVSDGDRYKENYIPDFDDITVTVPGKDGAYYFGSNYTQRTFNIKFAFDNLKDSQIRRLRQILGKKTPQNLIFDETPYKVYVVKAQGPPNLSYVAFNEGESRIYKGEGEITFVAYYPFARSRYKYLEDYNSTNIPEWRGIESNLNEWKDSSKIISRAYNEKTYGEKYEYTSKANFDVYTNYAGAKTTNRLQLYNAGDFPTDCKIYVNLEAYINDTVSEMNSVKITLYKNKQNNHWSNTSIDSIGYIFLRFPENTDIKRICIDGEHRLILGYKYDENNNTYVLDTENVYNNYIEEGDFFQLPVLEKTDTLIIGTANKHTDLSIDYDYLYY
jgi:hypothetical protein